jgi:hypothetical protein
MKKLFFVFITFFAILVAIFFILDRPAKTLSESQKQEALTNILGRKPNLNNGKQLAGNIDYKGKHVSFSYPARARIYNSTGIFLDKNSNYVENFSFDISIPRLIFTLAVKRNDTNISNFSDISDVKLRQLPSMGYGQKDLEVDGEKGIVFEKQGDNPEITAFFIVKDKIYSFVVTGSDFRDVEKLFNDLEKTIKFVR